MADKRSLAKYPLLLVLHTTAVARRQKNTRNWQALWDQNGGCADVQCSKCLFRIERPNRAKHDGCLIVELVGPAAGVITQNSISLEILALITKDERHA